MTEKIAEFAASLNSMNLINQDLYDTALILNSQTIVAWLLQGKPDDAVRILRSMNSDDLVKFIDCTRAAAAMAATIAIEKFDSPGVPSASH